MDRTYGVELKLPGALPTLVTSFRSKDAAIGWIERVQGQLQRGTHPSASWLAQGAGNSQTTIEHPLGLSEGVGDIVP